MGTTLVLRTSGLACEKGMNLSSDSVALIPLSLYRALTEQHRTMKEHDPFSPFETQFHVWCRACDGHLRHIWRPGETDYRCDLGREIDLWEASRFS
jgi:hypothetical protein